MNMADTIIALVLIVLGAIAALAYWADLINPLSVPRNAAPAPVLDPQVPARATKCPTIGHRMVLSDLQTWWFCLNDGCTEMWPADEAHHVDLPYDREAVQLVDETEQFLRRVS